MKNKFLPFILGALFLLFSCSQISQNQCETFSFDIGQDLVSGIARSLKVIVPDFSDPFTIKVTLSGEVNESKTEVRTLQQLQTSTVTFDFQNIPLNKKFDITVQVFIYDDVLVFEGKSTSVTIDSASKKLEITVKELQHNEYVLISKTNGSCKYGVFTPYAVKNASLAEENNCSDFDFDAQGNIWMIDSTTDTELKKYVNNDWKTDEALNVNPSLVCVDRGTNTLIVGEVEGENMNFYCYSINTSSISDDFFTNDKEEENYKPANTISFNEKIKETGDGVPDYNDIKCIAAYNNVLYVATTKIGGNSFSNKLYAYDIKYEKLNSSYSMMGDYNKFGINDLTVQDGYLYAVMDCNSTSDNILQIIIKSKSGEITTNSFGLVAKISLDLNSITPLGNQTYPITESVQLPIYYNSFKIYSEENFQSVIKDSITIKYNSPTSKTSKEFFGPKKIVALRPKKLVFLDSGVFLYQEDDDLFYKPMNRLVTIDLETFAVSSIVEIENEYQNIENGSGYLSISNHTLNSSDYYISSGNFTMIDSAYSADARVFYKK